METIEQAPARKGPALLAIAFFLSGVAGLVFEIVWMRHLGLALGTTTLAVATTTGAYMGGLALGSAIGGRWADTLKRPVVAYGAVELVIALFGAIVPYVASQWAGVDAALLSPESSMAARALMRFVVALGILCVPTTLMGMTLPLLARAVGRGVGRVGRDLGALYGWNLAGATVGAALAGFVFIPHVGLRATNLLAVGIDAVLGLAMLLYGFSLQRNPLPPPRGGGLGWGAASQQPVALFRPGSAWLMTALALSGLLAMALQVLWTRALSTALGPSTYAFTTIVCAYLLGLGLGAHLAAFWADRVLLARLALAWNFVLAGAATLLGLVVVDDLPVWLHQVVVDPDLTVTGLVRTEFLLAAVTVLPATVAMGSVLPLMLSAVCGNDERLGAAVGWTYLWNTTGAILGVVLGTFVFLPVLGVEWGMRLCAIGYAVLALGLLVLLEIDVSRPQRSWLLGVALLVSACSIVWPRWNVGQWTSGVYRVSMSRDYAPGQYDAGTVIFHEDGLAATVTVEEEDDVRWIKVGGKTDGSSYGDMSTQVLSGILPLLLHDHRLPKRNAVIGCGTGVTAGVVLAAGVPSLHLIEIEPQVIAGAKLFESVNRIDWGDPRLTVVADDGRNFMVRTKMPFDIIISEPSNPWMSGAASLFTQEFFQIARAKLADDGVFLQWLQAYELAPERIMSILKTFHSVFPHVLVFVTSSGGDDLLLVGKQAPYALAFAELEGRARQHAFELTRAGLSNAADVLALALFDDTAIDRMDVQLNTDDNALIEFGAPRDLLDFASKDVELPVLEEIRGQRLSLVRALMPRDPPPAAKMAWAYLGHGMFRDATAAVALARAVDPAFLPEAERILQIVTLLEDDVDQESIVDESLARTDAGYADLLRASLKGVPEQALRELAKLGDRREPAVVLLAGYLHYLAENHVTAAIKLKRSLHEGYRPRAAQYYLARNAYAEAETQDAVRYMVRYLDLLQEISH